MQFLKILLALSLSFSAYSAVWVAHNSWDEHYEKEYEEWISSREVHANLFVGRNSKYYGIRADCADAVYAMRAIFSFENQLPFAINNPSGSRSHNYLTNRSTAFDRISNPYKRVVAFLNYLGDSVGTENLSRMDTYPVKLSTIRPATMFTYKISRSSGKVIRHAYMIKDIQVTGSFDLLYSTQAISKEGLPMNYRKGKELVNLPHSVWGFRRFKQPNHLKLRPSSLPISYDYSEEQFSLAKQLGKNAFFTHVKNMLKTVNETPNNLIKRVLSNLCDEVTQRIGNVEQGVAYNNSVNGRCMNYRDYDTYSTPARDAAVKASFEAVIYHWNSSYSGVTDNRLIQIVQNIFVPKNQDDALLLSFCPIKVKGLKTYTLEEIWNRVNTNTLSSHPNDSLRARWGEPGPRTSCKVWY